MTCAKTVVRATAVLRGPLGTPVVFTGENRCRNPQEVCPREPGEGYAKCASICDQVGHAELDLVNQITGRDDDYFSLKGSSVVITGHTYVCRECQEALYDAGVKWIGVV